MVSLSLYTCTSGGYVLVHRYLEVQRRTVINKMTVDEEQQGTETIIRIILRVRSHVGTQVSTY